MRGPAAIAIAALVCACAAVPAGEQPIRHLASGQFGQTTERRFEMITDAVTFRTLWATHVGGPPPEVDFPERAVIAAFYGQERTGGHSIRVAEVTRHGNKLRIVIETRSPGPDCRVAEAFTQPYQFVSVPDGVATYAEFVSRHVTETCE